MKLLLFLCVVVASGQTRVRPEQIKNVQQVRIYWGDFMGPTTHVTAGATNGQISDGRFIMTPEQYAASSFPADDIANPLAKASIINGTPTPQPYVSHVCVVDWFGIGPIQGANIPPWNQQTNIRTYACYTQLGLAALRNDPNWAAWLIAHGV